MRFLGPEAPSRAQQRAPYAEAELGATVKDVQRDRLGWDLELTLPDGAWQPVEVKGSRGSGAFAITRNERRQAELQPDFALYFVYDLGTAFSSHGALQPARES